MTQTAARASGTCDVGTAGPIVAGVAVEPAALGMFVDRPRLVRRLEEGNGRVVLLDAPTGYGKSVLLAQWAARDPRPFASVSLAPEHDDPAALVSAILAALSQVEPVPADVGSALQGPEPDFEGVVLPRLARAMGGRTVPVVLVLDELEHIHSRAALRVIRSIADHLPGHSQLAIAARSAAELPLGRLRANRRLTELRRTALVMTRAECGSLLAGLGLELNPTELDTIVRRTEGWPAALYLAGIALLDQSDVASAISSFAGDDRIVVDYIRDEFLLPATKHRVGFLKQVAILDRFNGDLCDAVLERNGSATTLRHLSRDNVLLVPLDRRDEWFRFHALFSEMLRSELHSTAPRDETGLHSRASRWWSDHGDLGRAIEHAIAAREYGRAGELVWAAVPEYYARGRAASLRRFLDRLGHERVVSDPFLACSLAHGYLVRGDGSGGAHWLGVTRALLRQQSSRPNAELEGGLALGEAELIREVEAMRELASRAGRAFPEGSPWLALSSMFEGIAYQLAGQREQAHEKLSESARRAAVFGAPILQCIALAQLALLAADRDDWHVVRMLAAQGRSQVERSGLAGYPTMAIVVATSAYSHAREGRAEEAAADLRLGTRLVKRLDRFGPWYEIETRLTLARAAVRLDNILLARRLIDEADGLLTAVHDAPVLAQWLSEARTAVSAVTEAAVADLTPAELRVLRFLPTHLSFPQIAAEVYVSPNTVKTQAQAVYRKLDVSSRREAVERAREAGLLDHDPVDR
jgi:LuxR family transcriptional regulator, maltose regulon positive regulatory protein